MIAYGIDGNGDGVANVYGPADAIPAAAAYLVAHGAHEDVRKALYAYNPRRLVRRRGPREAAEYGAADVVEVASVAGQQQGCSSAYATAGSDGVGAGPWGGHPNGRIPLDELGAVEMRHLLRCDAAVALEAMMAAHLADTRRPLTVTDAYRDYDGQVDVARRKPHLAATPGLFQAWVGLAVDLVVDGWNGQTFRWLQANAHRYGWHHPAWARIDGSNPEPWHWEFGL